MWPPYVAATFVGRAAPAPHKPDFPPSAWPRYAFLASADLSAGLPHMPM
jgi:hypothetical protein